GGGSSDAAAVLRGLNRLWSVKASLWELAALGSEIGSDVPFCIHGGSAIARGRGERIETLPSPPPWCVVLAKSYIGDAMITIFPQLNLAAMIHPDTVSIVDALYDKSFSKLCVSIGNVF